MIDHHTAFTILSVTGFVTSVLTIIQSLQSMYWMKQYQVEHEKAETYRKMCVKAGMLLDNAICATELDEHAVEARDP